MENQNAKIISTDFSNTEIQVLLSNGTELKIPLALILTAPAMQESLRFLAAGVEPLLRSAVNLSQGYRFGVASVLAQAKETLRMSER